MKSTRLLLPCLVVGMAGAGFWALRQERPRAAQALAQSSPADMLAMLPDAGGKSASDREIAKTAERLRRAPKQERSWIALGDALMQKCRETLDASYYAHAERAYRNALEIQPQSVPARVGMAWVTGGRHEFEQSREWASRAVALDPGSHAAYGILGDAAVEMGDYDAAFTHYQKMVDTRPDIASYSRGAHLLYLTGQTTKAILLMAKAIQAGGQFMENTAWCRAQLARYLFNNGNTTAAERTLQAALKQSPDNPHLLAAMGRVQTAKKDFRAAIESYKKASAIVPQHETLAALGDLYLLTGQKEEAQRQFAQVEAIHKLNRAAGVQGDMQIARFYADHDRNLPEALIIAEAEYRSRPNVYAADTLAWCYYKNGRYAEAGETIRKAFRQRTPEPDFHFHAGMIYAKLGDRDAARRALHEALSRNAAFHPVNARIAADTLKRLESARAVSAR